MSAVSPRQPRRPKGRHRKPSNLQASTYAHWLGVGAVGIGLAASAAGATGVASADDSSGTNSSPGAPGHGTAGPKRPVGADHSRAESKRRTTAGSAHTTNTTDDASTGSSTPAESNSASSDDADDAAPTATPRTPSPQARRWKHTQTDPAPSAHPTPPPATQSQRHLDVYAAPSAATPAGGATASTNVVVTPAPSAAVDADVPSSADGKVEPKPTGFQAVIDDVLKTIGLDESRNLGSSPIGPVDAVVPAMWLAARQHRYAQISKLLPADTTTTSDGPPDTPEPMASADAGGLTATGIGDESGDVALDVIDVVPVVGAPLAGKLATSAFAAVLPADAVSTDALPAAADPAEAVPAAAVSAAADPAEAVPAAAVSAAADPAAPVPAAAVNDGSTSSIPGGPPDSLTIAVMERAVYRLAGMSAWIWHQEMWPGTPHQFVDVTDNQIDRTLDTADDQLDAMLANAVAGTVVQWVADVINMLHVWIAPAIPNYSFSDTLNAMGDFLNRVVPRFVMADGADTLAVISVYKIVGAAVAGIATALSDMLNGVYDLQQIAIDVIYTTTGATVTRSDLSNMTSLGTKVAASIALGGGIYSHPEKLLATTTLPTWTAAQFNPFTIVTYIALVAAYKWFQEISNFAVFTTSTTYEDGLQTAGLTPETASQYAYGTFHAVDQDGRTVSFQPADGNTYTSAWGAQVTINTYEGGYSYTNTLPGAAFFAAGAAGQSDTVQIPVYSEDGAPYTLTFSVQILTVAGTALPGDSAFTTSTTYNSGSPSTAGLTPGTTSEYAYGTFHAVDQNGVAASFSPASGNTYTSAWGALVTINSTSGGFSYTQSTPGAAYFHAATSANPDDRYDTVQVTVQGADGKNYLVTQRIQIVQISGANSAPTSSYNQSNNSIDALGVVRGNVSGSDSDGDTITYSLVGSSVNGLSGNSAYTKNGATDGGIVTLNANGSFTYVSTAGAGTSQSFQVQMTDGHGGTTTTTVTVQNVPTLTPANPNTSTQNVVTGSVPAPSLDTEMFTYSLGTAPSKGSVTSWNPATGAFTYTRNSSLGHTTSPNDAVTVIATDANGRTVTLSLAVNPTVSNSAPVGAGVTTDAPVGSPTYNAGGGPRDEQHTTGTLNASDADGDALTFAAGTYTTAQGGSITVNANGTFTYDKNVFAPFGAHNSYWHDHAADGDPGDLVTINVSDGFGGVTAVTFGIPIAKLNEAPTLAGTLNGTPTADALGIRRGSINTGSDGDGDSLTYSLVGASGGSAYTANGGIVTMTGTSFTYIPKVGVTSDSFQVQVNDGHGGVTTATVNLTGLTTPGTATGVDRTTTLGTETGTLSIPTPSDTTALGLTYSVDTGPSKGTVQLVNTNGTYTYTYVRNSSLGHTTTTDDSFTIKATDATGKTVTVATINVAPQNYADVAPVVNSTTTDVGSADTNKWALNTSTWTQKTTGKINAADADGDTLTYSLVNPTTHATTTTTTNGGTVTFNADGSYTYSITKNQNYFHNASRTDATGGTLTSASDTTTRASIDTFGVAVSDGQGQTTYTTVTINIYGYNTGPTINNGVSGIGNTYWTSVTAGGGTEGDSIGSLTISKQPQHGSASYSAQVLSTSGASSGDTVWMTLTETNSYNVVNGIVQNGNTTNGIATVATLSSSTKQWTVGQGAGSAVYV